MRMAAAVKLFEMGRLSSGAAAELAGVPKPLFLLRLGDYGVDTFRQTKDELRRDLDKCLRLGSPSPPGGGVATVSGAAVGVYGGFDDWAFGQ